jgi:WD40 repeat protein/DNA-binding SARP family transcriptional activator
MEYRVLGTLEVLRDGEPIPLDSTKQRALLAALLIHANEVVSTERLIEYLWRDSPPEAGVKTLRFHVSKLRDALDPDRSGAPLVTKSPGYLLDVAPESVDANEFEKAVDVARKLSVSDPAGSVEMLRSALAMWRGRAFAEFQYEEFAHAAALRLDEVRLTAVEDRIDVELALGHHFELAGELEALVVEHPFRERLTEMWMLALYRSGRQAEALRAFQMLRTRLVEELGAEPGPAIVSLEQRILEQDRGLDVRVESRALGVSRAVRGYELRGLVRKDRLGEVHRAYKPSSGREVAIKIIGPEHADKSDFVQRFEAGAERIAALRHDYIVPLYDYWREPGNAYLVTRWLRGGDLKSALQRRQWAPNEAMIVLDSVGSALAYAHRLGVLHLDVRPANILLDDDGTPALGGFGAARLVEASGLTGAAQGPLAPEYAAPEQLTGGRVGQWTDVYQFALLAFEMLTGAHPFRAETPERTVDRRLDEQFPSASARMAEVPPAVDSVLAEAASCEPDSRPGTVADFLEALHDALGVAPTTQLPARRNPYKGLAAFQGTDAADFFGRDELVARLVSRFAEESEYGRFLAAVGPSGSGKSSVARAGVIPALRSGAVPGSDRWLFAEMQPSVDPFHELESALRAVAVGTPEDLAARLHNDDLGIHEAIRRSLPGEGWELFLLVDQFEELFAMCPEPDRTRFVAALVAAATHPRSQLRVMVTLRADYFDRPLLHNELGELMRSRTETVLPLASAALEEAVVRPADAAGVSLEPGLVGEILGDANGQPGSLPLVQYALTELFERSGESMMIEDYRAIGGMSGALGQRADAVLEVLSEPARAIAPRVFLELVELGEGAEDTRRRVHKSALANLDSSGAAAEVIDRFGEARLLSFDRDPTTRSATVEVAHEALLSEWATLRRWIDDGRDHLRMVRRLEDLVEEWESSGRDKSLLLRGTRLDQADGISKPKLRAFVSESRKARSRGIRRRRLAMFGLAALSGLLAVAAAVAVRGRNDARAATVTALADSARALSDHDPALALAVALEADEAGGTARTRGALLTALNSFTGRRGLRVATLRGFEGSVWSLAYTADGSRLYGASDGLLGVQQWDVATNQAGMPLEDWNEKALREIAITRDGRILSASLDNTVGVRDLDTGAVLFVLEGHEHQVWALDVHDERNIAASGSRDGTARIWDLATGVAIRVIDTKASDRQSDLFPDTNMDVWSVRFSPDGSQLATTGEDGMVRIWDAATGEELIAVQAHTESGQDLAYAPDGSVVYSAGDDGIVVVVDALSGSHRGDRFPHSTGLRSLDIDSAGTRMVTGAVDGSAVLWDLRSRNALAVMGGHDGLVNDVSFDRAGRLVATAGQDGTIQLWDTEPSAGVTVIDGHARGDGGVPQKRVLSLAFHPDGTLLVTGSADGTAGVWDTRDGSQVHRFVTGEDHVRDVAISPDGQIVATGLESGKVRLWDTNTGAAVDDFDVPDKVRGLAFTSDGNRIVAGAFGAVVSVYDLQARATIGSIAAHPSNTRQLALSSSGTLAVAGGDGLTQVWTMDTGELVADIPGHGGEVRRVVFSLDGSMMATSSSDGVVKVWDANTYENLATLTGHVAGIRALAISPDSRLLASGSEDLTIRFWDVDTQSPLAAWRRQTRDIWSVAFSPDGEWLASASADGTAVISYAGSDAAQICGWLQPYVSRPDLVEALGGNEPVVCTNLE